MRKLAETVSPLSSSSHVARRTGRATGAGKSGWPTEPCGLAIAAALFAAACSPELAQEPSEFLQDLIEEFEAAPASESPGDIWRFSYSGRIVYYVPPLPCCDRWSTLYEVDGEVVCAPDGGLTGRGDGRCPDFFELRAEPARVWHDERLRAD